MRLVKIALGSIAGAVIGFAAGVLLAPRSGAESRAMASDVVNDAWDSAMDKYEQGQKAVNEKLDNMRPNVDATTDELRAKVDLARERMDQLRDSLNTAAEEGVAPVADADADADDEAGDKVEVVFEAAEEPAAEEAAADEAEAEE